MVRDNSNIIGINWGTINARCLEAWHITVMTAAFYLTPICFLLRTLIKNEDDYENAT